MQNTGEAFFKVKWVELLPSEIYVQQEIDYNENICFSFRMEAHEPNFKLRKH